ncbi:MAG: hypothetical protein QF541_00885 [Lentisphaeria bacterium]|jgi:hypothetical protein|nr:hypothetical protein [Lentisphaeria bacterium]
MHENRTWFERAKAAMVLAVIVAGSWTWCTVAPAKEPGAAGTISPDDLPKVLAKVNGKPIRKADVLPGLAAGVSIASALKGAIDEELIAQQPVPVEQLTDEQAEHIKRLESTVLAYFYQKTIPELARRNQADVTEAEIDAYLVGNPKRLARNRGEARRRMAASLVVRQQYAEAHGNWLKARLAGTEISVNGEELSPAVMEQAVQTMVLQLSGSRQAQSPVLFEKISEMVIAQAAQERGDPAETLANDPDLVKELLTQAVIEADGHKLVLGDLPNWPAMTARADAVLPDGLLVGAIKERVLVADARAQGIDKDPDFQKQLERSRGSVTATLPGSSPSDIYYVRHGLGRTDVKVTETELEALHQAVMQALLYKGEAAAPDALHAYLRAAKLNWAQETKQKDVDAEATDAELEALHQAIMQVLLHKGGAAGTNGLREYLQSAKLDWLRELHLKGLRKAAKIKLYVN